jgi:hypothetical protein
MDRIDQLTLVASTDDRSTDDDGGAAAFLDALAREQARFLGAVGEARRLLRDRDGQLSAAAAMHARLAHELFDAQRMILRHRAETDAEVARIAHVTAAQIDAIGEAGPDDGVLDESDRDPDSNRRAHHPAGSSVRRQIADLGVDVVRTPDDVRSLAAVIDDAFAPDEPDIVTARRQLREVLDQWWVAERREAKAEVDDAHARAAMHLHLARVDARVDVGDVAVEPPPAEPASSEVARPEIEPIAADPADVEALDPGLVRAGPVAAERVDPVGVEPNSGDLPPLAPPAPPTAERRGLPPPAPAPSLDAAAVMAALDDVDGGDIDATLSTLLSSLDDRSARSLLDRSIETSAAVELAPATEAPQESFDRFWTAVSEGREAAKPATRRDLVSVRVMMPAVAVVAAFAAVLAWIG